ncbi:MAG: M23 family peptidase, partial [Solirubrobacteraceae bacterium]
PTAAPGAANADGEQLTSIAAQVLRAPRPGTLADGRTHLAYELRLANSSRSAVALESLEARSPKGPVLARLSGTALADRVGIDGGRAGLVLEPGWGGTVVMDAVVPRGKRPPSTLVHRFH